MVFKDLMTFISVYNRKINTERDEEMEREWEQVT